MKDVKFKLSLAAGLVGAALVIYGFWHLERWLNWELGYSSKVDDRLKRIELRLDKIESSGNSGQLDESEYEGHNGDRGIDGE